MKTQTIKLTPFAQEYVLSELVAEAIINSYGKSGIKDAHQEFANQLNLSRNDAKKLYFQWLYTPEDHHLKNEIREQREIMMKLVVEIKSHTKESTKEVIKRIY